MSESSTRWEREATFFDRTAEEAAARLRPISPLVLARYSAKRQRVLAPEYRFIVAGDLAGRRVLDVGCGDGSSSVLLALLGARDVHGIDISPGAIEVAKQRAELNGVADRVQFTCAPLETVDLPESHYDLIWCDAILHHLIADLDATMARFRRWAAENGSIVMTEPVNLNRALRRLRFMVAKDSNHTPDERPLEHAELNVIARRLPEVQFRFFRALGRIDGYVIPDYQYETAAAWRKVASRGIAILDWWILSLPPFQNLASSVVMSALVKK